MPRAQVIGRRSLAQRKTDRRALGTLQSLVVAPSTHTIDTSRLFHVSLNSSNCMDLDTPVLFPSWMLKFVNLLNICGTMGSPKPLLQTA